MIKESESASSTDLKKEVVKEELKLQFHWYMLSFFTIFLFSFFIPGVILYFYVKFFFAPYFLENPNILGMVTDFYFIMALLLMPLVIIGCYLIHLFFVGLITRYLWRITEKKSPTKDGIIPRNVNSRTLDFYNIRSFMIKYPKNAFVKGPFPWLINWLYNFVGTNKIGKGTTIEEEIGADRYFSVGKNCVIGVNSGISSHLVEGIFGNISYFEIKVGDNSTTAGINCISPGVEMQDNSYLLPLASCTKYNMLKGNNYYFGAPLRKIFKRKVCNYLNLTEEDLKRDQELRMKQQQEKINNNRSE